VAVLVLVPIYALCFVSIKAGLPYAPPLRFAGLRLMIAGVSLLLLALAFHHSLWLSPKTWLWVVPLALSVGTINYGAMFLSPGRAGAGIASVLGNAQALFIIVLAILFLGEHFTRAKGLALVLGLLGVLLISASDLMGANAYGLSGALLALLSSAGVAVGSVLVKRFAVGWSVLTVTAWALLLGSLPLLGGSLLLERTAEVRWTQTFLGLLFFLALLGSAFTTSVWYWLVQRDDVSRLSLFLFLVPVCGVLFAVHFFHEEFTLFDGLGIILTITGITAALWGDRPARSAAAPQTGAGPSSASTDSGE
jgi:O-acetylserine/cysteine efflux transporter